MSGLPAARLLVFKCVENEAAECEGGVCDQIGVVHCRLVTARVSIPHLVANARYARDDVYEAAHNLLEIIVHHLTVSIGV